MPVKMSVKMRGVFETGAQLGAASGMMRAQTLSNLAREAHLLQGKIRSGIRSQAPGGKKFKPLAQTTIDLSKAPSEKGGKKRKAKSKALIVNADLLQSVNAQKVKADEWFVGVHKKERTKDGRSLENIAMIHEEGSPPYTIPVTEEVHRFLLFMKIEGIITNVIPVGGNINHPGIPARPFLMPSFEQWQEEAQKRYIDMWRAKLGPLGFRG